MGQNEVDIDTEGPFKATGLPQGNKLEFSPGYITMAEAERQLIFATLEYFRGDKQRTANALGVSLKTIYNRLNHYLASGMGLSQRDSH